MRTTPALSIVVEKSLLLARFDSFPSIYGNSSRSHQVLAAATPIHDSDLYIFYSLTVCPQQKTTMDDMELQESLLSGRNEKHVSQRSSTLGDGKGCLLCVMFLMIAVSLLSLMMSIFFAMTINELESDLDQLFSSLDQTKINFVVSPTQNKGHYNGIVDAGGQSDAYICSYMTMGADCKGKVDQKEQALIEFSPTGPNYYIMSDDDDFLSETLLTKVKLSGGMNKFNSRSRFFA